MKSIELMVRFSVMVEDANMPKHVEDLYIDVPLAECKLYSVDSPGKVIPVKAWEFETMESYTI